MLKTTTPWCSGVSSVILPRCAFKTWLPYKNGSSPEGFTHTYQSAPFWRISRYAQLRAGGEEKDVPCTWRILRANLMMWYQAWISPFSRIYQNMCRGRLGWIVRPKLLDVALLRGGSRLWWLVLVLALVLVLSSSHSLFPLFLVSTSHLLSLCSLFHSLTTLYCQAKAIRHTGPCVIWNSTHHPRLGRWDGPSSFRYNWRVLLYQWPALARLSPTVVGVLSKTDLVSSSVRGLISMFFQRVQFDSCFR